MKDLMSILYVFLVFLVMFIIILIFIYWYMSKKNKEEKENEEGKKTSATTKVASEYTKKSIFKFMQFDKIDDNMIIQDAGKRYLMVIECEGINYDLMSQVEKTAIEAGFVQFLNTLRYPIQLYIQTRTVAIEESIQNYKNKLDETKKELENKQKQYHMYVKADVYDEKKVQELKKEITRIKNLCEYGQDIIEDIQKTSQNRSVLRKHYYVVVPYYTAELGIDFTDEEEKKNMVFSELYTRSQALIRALFSCDMKCRILNSNELVDLLYVAYNREGSETYGIDKAIQAGYTELYSTAPDVLDKRMKALDSKIEENAIQLASEAIDEARLEKERKIREKEKHFEEKVRKMAVSLLKENERYIGKEIAEDARKKINKETEEEGGNLDEQETKTRKRKTTNSK